MKPRHEMPPSPLSDLPLPPPRAADESPAWHFAGAYLLLVLLGFIAFRHPSTMVRGNELSADRALFASVNAVTLSGFQQAVALNEYRLPGQITALALTIAGTLLALIAGGMAVARIARLQCSDRAIVIGACTAEAAAALVGLIALRGHSRDSFAAIFQALSAFGHSGLYVGVLPGTTDWRTHVVLMPLALLGAISIPVLLVFARRCRRHGPMNPFARQALALWALAYLIGVVALCIAEWRGEWRLALANASAQSINVRTIGFPYPIGDNRAAHWVLMLLMAIGGAAGGGVKLTALARIVAGIRATLRGAAPGAIFAVAVIWLAAYSALVVFATIALLAVEPGEPADRLLFLVISAASNVGLSYNPVSTTGAGSFVLSGAMLMGRLLPLVALWWVVALTQAEGVARVG